MERGLWDFGRLPNTVLSRSYHDGGGGSSFIQQPYYAGQASL